ncbi:MAG TPA: DUF3703 domain-containing protein [Candidatus Binataceae bacterium]|nr:DUF3703 domain-containing protein [Candidatus Binataceae bacterium]
MPASNSSFRDRWVESRKYLRLCHAAFNERRYPEALNWLHEAHNLGRDHVLLHAVSHLSYIRFSWKDSDYKHVLGHLFWAICSPVMVPLERQRRIAVIGEWKPAPDIEPVSTSVVAAPTIATPSISAAPPAADGP